MLTVLKARSLGPTTYVTHSEDALIPFINAANDADNIAWARHCWIVHNRHGEWRKEFMAKGIIRLHSE